MRILMVLMMLCSLSCCEDVDPPVAEMPPRQLVPLEVMERARLAVQGVVDETVRGNYQANLDAMHPGLLKAMARPFGGAEKLKGQMLKMMNQMGGNGIAVQAIITRKPEVALEVDYGFQDILVEGKPVMGPDGKPTQEATYRSWMVFVPTVMDVFIRDQEAQPPVVRRIRKWGFEVAISPKREEKWTFMSGNSINPMLLRQVFPFLPKDEKEFQFPEVKMEELKQ